MEGKAGEYLSIYCASQEDEDSIRGFTGGRLSSILEEANERVVDVSVGIIRDNMRTTLRQLLGLFEEEDVTGGAFVVDEINVSLNIDVQGTVSVLSVSGGGASKSGISLRLKRRPEGGGECG